MSHGLRHLQKHSQKRHSPLAKFFDKSMYLIAVGSPLMTLPQFLEIWQTHHVQGVSPSTWGAYSLFSLMWSIYGVLHKDKVILLSNIPMFLLDSAIFIGVIFFQ